MSIDGALPEVSGREAFRVGDWTVEPALNQLTAGAITAAIEPKAMAVLCYLAQRPGQPVSREELLAAVWPGVVVGDDALTQVVVKLRKALGDVPDKPVYIQTISKKGYRLVAPVSLPASPAAAQAPPPVGAPRPEARRPRFRLAAAAGATLMLVAAAALWITGGPPEVAPERAAMASDPAARAAQSTVAILPFEAIGNDPQEAVLARGITADLVTDLSKVSGLWVIRVSPAGGPTGAQAPAGDSTIRYLVTGAVQRLDNRVRLHVHLSDAQTGKQLWSERYDRALSGIFEIQDEIGPRILESLPVKVSEAERRRVALRYTRNFEAYETFQRGQIALHVRRKAENELAGELFRQAIAQDAGFARAYAGLAMTYTADYRNQWAGDGAAALERAFELARTAHQIDPDIPESYWVLAFVHVHRHQHDQALRHLETALRLNPSFADAYATMGGIYTSVGRSADAVPLLRTAIRLLPESGYLYLMLLGRAYLFTGDLEQAKVNLSQALLRNPEFLDARVYLAAVQVEAGDKAAAAWEAEEIRALHPDFNVRRWLDTNPMVHEASKAKLVRALGELGF